MSVCVPFLRLSQSRARSAAFTGEHCGLFRHSRGVGQAGLAKELEPSCLCCLVDKLPFCIFAYRVDKADLPALEYVMQCKMTERVNVGVMMAGQGAQMDVFASTASFLKERKRKEEARARANKYYSPQQEAARRKAAEELARQHLGFFAQVRCRKRRGAGAGVAGGARRGRSRVSISPESDVYVGMRASCCLIVCYIAPASQFLLIFLSPCVHSSPALSRPRSRASATRSPPATRRRSCGRWAAASAPPASVGTGWNSNARVAAGWCRRSARWCPSPCTLSRCATESLARRFGAVADCSMERAAVLDWAWRGQLAQ